MACQRHLVTSPDTCPACRNNEWMAQSRRHHAERMGWVEPRKPFLQQLREDTVKGGKNMALVVLAIPVLIVLGLVVGLVMGILSLAVALIQGALVGLLIGGLVGGVSYAVLRRRNPDAPAFEFTKPDASLPVKERALTAYGSLDPISARAAKHGSIAGAVAALWVVLF